MAKKGPSDPDFFGTQKISKILLKTLPLSISVIFVQKIVKL